MFRCHYRLSERAHRCRKSSDMAGFSLVELLISIFIIGLLITILVSALDVPSQLGLGKNAVREQAIGKIAHAISEYVENEDLSFLFLISQSGTSEICAADTEPACSGLFSLVPLLKKDYLMEVPRDPDLDENTGAEHSGYFIQRIRDRHIIITAPSAANGETISVER